MRQILAPLWRHRLMPSLVVIQVALACAIACNAMFLLQQRLVPVLMPDGIGDPARLIVGWDIASRGDPWPPARLRALELRLRALPGVASASVAGSLPMQMNAQMSGDVVVDDGAHGKRTADAVIYLGDGLVQTLGVQLVAGRDFTAAEQSIQYRGMGINDSGPTIITQALADRLFPDGHALGQVIRIGPDADAARRTVVGVIAHLMRNKFTQDNRENIDYTMLFPGIPGQWPMPTFGVRARPGVDTEQLRKSVQATIEDEFGSELVRGFEPKYEMYASMRERVLSRPKAAVWLLAGVSLVVLLVATVGIMGLTGYWVQQRTRQIGVRRALGARRADILRELQLENLLVMLAGIVLGMLLTYAINGWLIRHYSLPPLPWIFLPLGAGLMLVLGQLAVWPPARRAANVPPVAATRSV